MNVEIQLNGSLLSERQTEWSHWLDHPDQNPLVTRAGFAGGEVLLENDLCVYTQDSRYSDGLPFSGLIVTRRPCETVFDMTPAEAAATHALLAEVRAHLDATVRPDGYTVGWNAFPAGGQHIPHVHLHVIPRWNNDPAAGAGLRYFLKVAAQSFSIRPALQGDLELIRDLIVASGLSRDRARITATLEGSSYWLAVQKGEIIGCIGLEHGEGASLLRSAAVRPDRQKQGVGGRLTEAALAVARGRGDRAVYLFSSGAGPYWQKMGFVQVPVTELSAALPGTPQVNSGECLGWIHDETAWKLEWSG
jgi:N-acetylglutamate synthase-like GNAT family acetyltransferase